jgi:phosphoglycerate dehydrogenase-like enzyme
LSEATRHIVNAERLALMKPTAWLINTSRGPTVDQKALYRALIDKRIQGAGLDVFEVEPCPADEPILRLDNVICAPHSLCWTDECFAGIGAADVAAVQAVMRGEVPRGIVNRAIEGDPEWQKKLAALRARLG